MGPAPLQRKLRRLRCVETRPLGIKIRPLRHHRPGEPLSGFDL